MLEEASRASGPGEEQYRRLDASTGQPPTEPNAGVIIHMFRLAVSGGTVYVELVHEHRGQERKISRLDASQDKPPPGTQTRTAC